MCMRKQLAGVGVGLLLLAPACALAQSTSITDQIAALLQQIKTLQAQIATLQLGSQHSCVDLSDNLTLGASGAAVSNLQNYLITKGYLGAQYHTGYYGFLTVAAVGKLQLQQGLVSSQDDQAYGIAGSKTRAAISCTGTTPPPPTPVACPSGYHSNGETCVSNVGSFAASPTYGVAPLAVTFKISATDSTYTINFGDGTSAPSPQPSAICSGAVVCTDPGTNISHTYTATGTYKAQLVKDPCAGAVGCVAPTQLLSTITISVVAVGQPQPQPVAGFTATPTAGAAPLAVSFSSSQAGTVNFGDGQSSMLQSSPTSCICFPPTSNLPPTLLSSPT